MKGAEVVAFIFILILVGILVRYYKGAAEIIKVSGSVVVNTIDKLQLRGA